MSSRRRWKWVAVTLLLAVSCSLAAWRISDFARTEGWVRYFSPEQVAARRAEREERLEHERQEEEIRSPIRHTVGLLTELGARCYEVPKKGDGFIDGIDLSHWRGTDRDLTLLRAFVLLEEDNVLNRNNNFLTLTLGTSATDASLAHLEELRNLRDLSIQGAQITDAGLDHLRRLTGLKILDLSGTRVTDKCIDHLNALPDLWRMDVSRTRISAPGIVRLSRLHRGLEVTFSGGQTRENSLSLAGPSATDDMLRRFTAARQFEYIDIRQAAITDAALVALQGQKQLRTLLISATPVTDAGMKHLRGLSNLERLTLSEVGITDAGLRELQGLTLLSQLNLSKTHLTDAGLAHVARLASLQRLDLCDTGITRRGLENLTPLTRLRELELMGTKVSLADARAFHPKMPQVAIGVSGKMLPGEEPKKAPDAN